MFVNVDTKHFEIVIISDHKLLFYNSFKHKSKEDFIYYILFTAEQLKLNPEKFELMLFGNISKEHPYYKMAYKYVRNIALLENRSKYKFGAYFKEETKRSFYTLLNQF
jgi:phosphoribosylformylglycinamidine (FGAM) synthase-like enzyme